MRGLVASWPSTSTGLRLLAARAYPLFFSLYAAGRADVLEAVAFRLRDILRQPIDPTGAHSIREAADALPLPGTAAAPVTLAQVRANGFGWAADWIAAGRMPVTPSIVPRTLDDLFPGGAAEAGRRVAAPSADDSLPVPEMPDVFGAGTVLPWELVRGFPDTLVYDLHATTAVKLPLQAVLALRPPLLRIFEALPSMAEGGGFTAESVLHRLSKLPLLSAPDSTGWRLDHWKALCGSTSAASGEAEPFRQAYAGFVVWMSHSLAENENRRGPGHRTRTALCFRLLQLLPRWLLTKLPQVADKAAAEVRMRCRLLVTGQWAALHDAACAADAAARARPARLADPIARAVSAMRDGRPSRAADALRDGGGPLPTAGSPFGNAVHRKLAEKHPRHAVDVGFGAPADGLPLGAGDHLAGGRVAALAKDPEGITDMHWGAADDEAVPDFKVRPIVTHSVWRRLSAVLQANGVALGKRLRAAGQYAVATPGGLDILIHSIRVGLLVGGERWCKWDCAVKEYRRWNCGRRWLCGLCFCRIPEGIVDDVVA